MVKLLRQARNTLEGRSRMFARNIHRWTHWWSEAWMEPEARLTFSQFGEDAFLQAYYRSKAWEKYGDPNRIDPGYYVDIGAHSPKTYSNTYWFYKHGWKGINIDAAPGTTREFLRERPRDTTLELAISDTPGELIFYSFGEPHVVNTLVESHANKWADVLGVPPARMKIQALRLEDVLDRYLPAGQNIDFCSIDVEGHDYEVLKSNNWKKFRPELMLVECHTSSWEDLLGSPTSRFLGDLGYKVCGWIPPTFIFKRQDDFS